MAADILHEADLGEHVLRLVRRTTGYRLVHLGRKGRIEDLVVLDRTSLGGTEADAWRAHLVRMAQVVQETYGDWLARAVDLTKRVSAQRGRLKQSTVRRMEAELEGFLDGCDRHFQAWVAPWCAAMALAVSAGASGLPAPPEGIAKVMQDLVEDAERRQVERGRVESTPRG